MSESLASPSFSSSSPPPPASPTLSAAEKLVQKYKKEISVCQERLKQLNHQVTAVQTVILESRAQSAQNKQPSKSAKRKFTVDTAPQKKARTSADAPLSGRSVQPSKRMFGRRPAPLNLTGTQRITKAAIVTTSPMASPSTAKVSTASTSSTPSSIAEALVAAASSAAPVITTPVSPTAASPSPRLPLATTPSRLAIVSEIYSAQCTKISQSVENLLAQVLQAPKQIQDELLRFKILSEDLLRLENEVQERFIKEGFTSKDFADSPLKARLSILRNSVTGLQFYLLSNAIKTKQTALITDRLKLGITQAKDFIDLSIAALSMKTMINELRRVGEKIDPNNKAIQKQIDQRLVELQKALFERSAVLVSAITEKSKSSLVQDASREESLTKLETEHQKIIEDFITLSGIQQSLEAVTFTTPVDKEITQLRAKIAEAKKQLEASHIALSKKIQKKLQPPAPAPASTSAAPLPTPTPAPHVVQDITQYANVATLESLLQAQGTGPTALSTLAHGGTFSPGLLGALGMGGTVSELLKHHSSPLVQQGVKTTATFWSHLPIILGSALPVKIALTAGAPALNVLVFGAMIGAIQHTVNKAILATLPKSWAQDPRVALFVKLSTALTTGMGGSYLLNMPVTGGHVFGENPNASGW